jgi:hypothetical protein
MRAPLPFKKTDVTRAVKAVIAAGLVVCRVEFGKDGKFIVFPGEPNEIGNLQMNEWDEVLPHGKAPEVR